MATTQTAQFKQLYENYKRTHKKTKQVVLPQCVLYLQHFRP